MKKTIKAWLDMDKISQLLSKEEITQIKKDYQNIFVNSTFQISTDDCDEISIMTGFPLVQEYYENMCDFITDDVETEKEYIYKCAELKLRSYILCACNIVFELPLWQTSIDVEEWKKLIFDILEQLMSNTSYGEAFPFATFFPYYSNEITLHPKYMLSWIYDVVDEFFDMAEHQYFYLSDEEREKQINENAKMLRWAEEELEKIRKK